ALPDGTMLQLRTVKLSTGKRQHFRTEVYADATLGAASEKFQHPSGAGTEINDEIEFPPRRTKRHHGLLDLGFGHIKRADTVPLLRIGPEIGRRPLRPRRPDGFKSFKIARNHE